MKEVGVKEFGEHASGYLAGGEALAVRRGGRVIGYYLPVRERDEEKLQAALRDLRESVADLRRESGLSEEELVAELVPRKHKKHKGGEDGRTGG